MSLCTIAATQSYATCQLATRRALTSQTRLRSSRFHSNNNNTNNSNNSNNSTSKRKEHCAATTGSAAATPLALSCSAQSHYHHHGTSLATCSKKVSSGSSAVTSPCTSHHSHSRSIVTARSSFADVCDKTAASTSTTAVAKVATNNSSTMNTTTTTSSTTTKPARSHFTTAATVALPDGGFFQLPPLCQTSSGMALNRAASSSSTLLQEQGQMVPWITAHQRRQQQHESRILEWGMSSLVALAASVAIVDYTRLSTTVEPEPLVAVTPISTQISIGTSTTRRRTPNRSPSPTKKQQHRQQQQQQQPVKVAVLQRRTAVRRHDYSNENLLSSAGSDGAGYDGSLGGGGSGPDHHSALATTSVLALPSMYYSMGPFMGENHSTNDDFELTTARARPSKSNRAKAAIMHPDVDHSTHSSPYDVSVRAIRGGRVTMEDEFCIADGGRFAAVFDGHGGGGVSQFLKRRLYEKIQRHLHQKHWEEIDDDSVIGIAMPSSLLKSHRSSTPSLACQVSAIRSAFQEAESEVLADDTLGYQGSTAVAVVVHESEDGHRTLLSANVGDSRAILSRRGRAVELTRDHKPNEEREKSRILAMGETIEWDHFSKVHRVRNLSLSRAIGDRYAKPTVSAEVEIRHFPVTEDTDEFILLASDGVWDVMSSQDVVTYVHQRMAAELTRRKMGMTQFGNLDLHHPHNDDDDLSNPQSGGTKADSDDDNTNLPLTEQHHGSSEEEDDENLEDFKMVLRRNMAKFVAREAFRRGSGDNICVLMVWLQDPHHRHGSGGGRGSGEQVSSSSSSSSNHFDIESRSSNSIRTQDNQE